MSNDLAMKFVDSVKHQFDTPELRMALEIGFVEGFNTMKEEVIKLRDAIATQAANGARTRNDLVEGFDKFLKTVK